MFSLRAGAILKQTVIETDDGERAVDAKRGKGKRVSMRVKRYDDESKRYAVGYANRYGPREAEAVLGVSTSTLRRWRKEGYGENRRTRWDYEKEKEERRIVFEYAREHSFQDAAKKYGVSISTIYRWYRENELDAETSDLYTETSDLKEEVEKLKEENEKLKEENDELKKRLMSENPEESGIENTASAVL